MNQTQNDFRRYHCLVCSKLCKSIPDKCYRSGLGGVCGFDDGRFSEITNNDEATQISDANDLRIIATAAGILFILALIYPFLKEILVVLLSPLHNLN